jgi:hypothetical protein
LWCPTNHFVAQEFLNNFNAHFDCDIVSSAKVFQSGNVRIGIADACGNPPLNSITIKATFAMIAYHQ